MKFWQKYGLFFLVYVASFASLYILPASDLIKGFMAFPGSVALLGVLYQLWRDDRAYERELELQNKQQDFALGTASHMASVAYDKHVDFGEEYMERVQSGFQKLMKDGPTKETVNIGGDLVRIRFKYAAWLTNEIEDKLKPFEDVLIKIGAKHYALEGLDEDEQRNKIINEIYDSFNLVVEAEDPETEEEALIALHEPIDQIRKILGIDALMALREKASEAAFERLKK